jgi:hypothetical protein
MEMTIIGVYDAAAHALSAKHALIAAGFARGRVQLNPDPELSARATAVPKPEDGSLDAGIGNFFRALFGTEDKTSYSNVYAEAVRRGGHVLTVDVESEEERARVEQIMNACGPVDIEARSADWIRHGWRGHDPAKAGMQVGAGGRLRALIRRGRKEEK